MKSPPNPDSHFVPLTAESQALYDQFWSQIGVATTTPPPMDFRELQAGALRWAARLDLPDEILLKFRQRIEAAASDAQVFAVMAEFQRVAEASPSGAKARAPATGGRNAGTGRKARRSMTLTMSSRAIELVDQGLSNRAIAAELGVSEATVRHNLAVKRARAALKARKYDFPPGHKSKQGAADAYANRGADADQ